MKEPSVVDSNALRIFKKFFKDLAFPLSTKNEDYEKTNESFLKKKQKGLSSFSKNKKRTTRKSTYCKLLYWKNLLEVQSYQSSYESPL